VYELEKRRGDGEPGVQEVQANPTPWTQRIGPQAVATTFIRNIYSMIHPRELSTAAVSSGPAPALQIGRMDVPASVDAEWNQWYKHDLRAELREGAGA